MNGALCRALTRGYHRQSSQSIIISTITIADRQPQRVYHWCFQIAHRSPSGGDSVVWNFPVSATFRGKCAHGWPRLVISVYGIDGFGRDIVRGYGTTVSKCAHILLPPCQNARGVGVLMSRVVMCIHLTVRLRAHRPRPPLANFAGCPYHFRVLRAICPHVSTGLQFLVATDFIMGEW